MPIPTLPRPFPVYSIFGPIIVLLMVLPVWAMAASPPDITARAAVVMDMASGEVLFARQPQQPLPPASTTKVLTALVALERLNPNTRITVSESAAAVEPSRIGLHAGEVLYAQDLFYGLLLKSGNDAAEVIAQAVGGAIPTFAELMNIRAWQIGARHSHFANPHGLPNSDHYTTAFDLALIFREAMQNPMFAEIVRTRSAELRVEPGYQFRGNVRWVPVRNSNRLLYSYAGNQGGKTGYTRLARNCYVGEASRGDVNLIVSVLGSTNRNFLWKDVSALFDYGFALRDKSAPATPTLLLTGSATRNESLKAD